MRKKRIKKKNKKNKIILIASWLTLCAAFGYFLPTLPAVKDFIKINKVKVEGTKRLKPEVVKKVFENENWFLVKEDSIKNKLKNYKFIRNIELERDKLGEITIKVEERHPFAYIKYKNDINVVDGDGIILNRGFFTKKELKNVKTVIIYNENNFKKEAIENVLKIRENFKDLGIKKFIINMSQIAVVTDGNQTLVFSKDDLKSSIKRAKLFFSEKNPKNYKYINFSFDSMVVARR